LLFFHPLMNKQAAMPKNRKKEDHTCVDCTIIKVKILSDCGKSIGVKENVEL
jgi:hypothetical protein